MNAIGLSPSSPSPSPNPSNQTKAQKDAETFGALASEYNNVGQWDQFAENAKKFGTRTDYDENLYTTRLNRGKGKDWDDKVKMAEQLEREILGGKSENSHIAEERGQVGAGEELDEEDK
jgi:PAB1-binding protein PBP1